MKLKIIREEWARGNPELRGAKGNKLYDRSDDRSCCLGFLGMACGYSKIDLNNEGLPNEQCEGNEHSLWPSWLVCKDFRRDDRGDEYGSWILTNICDDLIQANDDKDISEECREAKITKLMAQNGVEVTFE